MRTTLSIASVLTLLTALIPGCGSQGTTFTHVTAEGGVSNYNMSVNEGNGTYTEPSTSYQFTTGWKQGERASPHPVQVAWITPTTAEHFRGKESLEFQIDDHQEPGTAAYRANLNLSQPHDSFQAGVVQPNDRYLGFAMKIDPTYYTLPQGNNEITIAQWHQASPEHPPVALTIFPPAYAASMGWPATPTGRYVLEIRNDLHNAMTQTPGKALYYDLGPVTTGVWQTWVMHVRAGLQTNGEVAIWQNGRQLVDVTDQKVGYDPSNPQYAPHPPYGAFDYVNICIYREHGLNHQRLFFDEAKFADTYAAADPSNG